MRSGRVNVSPPDPEVALEAARAERDKRAGDYCPDIPGENLFVSVSLREGSYYHRLGEAAGGDGVTVLAGGELERAKFKYPQIVGFGENMRHAQAMSELEATKQAVKSAAALFKREAAAKSKSLSAREAAADKAAQERDAALAVREHAIAERERAADGRVRAAEDALQNLTSRIRAMAQPVDMDS